MGKNDSNIAAYNCSGCGNTVYMLALLQSVAGDHRLRSFRI